MQSLRTTFVLHVSLATHTHMKACCSSLLAAVWSVSTPLYLSLMYVHEENDGFQPVPPKMDLHHSLSMLVTVRYIYATEC